MGNLSGYPSGLTTGIRGRWGRSGRKKGRPCGGKAALDTRLWKRVMEGS